MTYINSITLNTQAFHNDQIITKSYVDQFHQESERYRRDLEIDLCNESTTLVKNNQDNNFKDRKIFHFLF